MSGRRDMPLDRAALELKVATRALIAGAGGTDGAGETCGARQQRMSDCQNRNTADFLRIDEVAALEDVTPGAPPVTAALAKRQGFLLVPLPRAADDPTGLLAGVMALTSELGDVARAIQEALADEDFTAAEAQHSIKQLDELDVASACLRQKLCSLVEPTPAKGGEA